MAPAVDEDADGGSDGHSQVVAQPVVADGLVAAARWQHVDGHGAVGHGQGPEGTAMQRSDNGEQQQGARRQITCKEDGKAGKAHHEHRLAREGVDHIAAERTEEQGSDGISRQHQSDDVFRGMKVLAQVERQQRG